MSVSLTPLGTYATGVFDEGAAEINAYDPTSQRLFVVNSDATTVDILDLSDPTQPNLVSTIDAAAFGGGANSVAVSNGVVAVAVEANVKTDPGLVVFFDANSGAVLNQVTVGALPDMVTFTPDGSKVLVANEGESDEGIDPEGTVSIIDISGGVANLTDANVATADFRAINGLEIDRRGDGVRIFPGASASLDFEPEYIAVSPNGEKAYVTLQEANSVAVVDIATATVEGIQPLGVKDFSRGLPQITNYDITDRGAITNGGEPLLTSTGETIELGGFSGLWFDGVADNGNLKFLAVPDRGPNGDADGNDRPFLLPDYQARVVSLELNESTGSVSITDELLLQRADGTPITGLPNIPNVDRQAVDASGNPVDLDALTEIDASVFGADYDPFGADLEGIVRFGDVYWMVDEYRPAIYQFNLDGTLRQRLVPEGTVDLANASNPGANFAEGTFGLETLPEEYLNRRANRGFEAMALDTDTGILYAFIQTPLSNPDRATGNASNVIRMLGIDPATGQPVSEYVYNLQKPEFGSNVDKIGDAVYAGNGKFYVMERDSSLDATAQKFIFEVDLTGATNVLGRDINDAVGNTTLEQPTTDQLVVFSGIQPVNKIKVTNLPSLGYLPSDKPEGLALLPDGRLAVLNDNDFGLEAGAEAVQLGIIDFTIPNGLDASDRDGGINIQNQPVYGLFMPDAIASYEVDGITYYVTANEGDDRGDADEDATGDAIRLKDLGDVTSFGRNGLALDERFDPALLDDKNLGRLTVSSIDGDLDGDGDLDQIFAYGTRSFSIFDENGNLVFDSGSQLEEVTAALFPNDFNATNDENGSFENRSDNKGPEPEGVTLGVVEGKTYAFIGLERIGGVAVYDISTPAESKFVEYINTRDFSGDAEAGTAGDLGPEGLTFIAAEDSPNGKPLLAVSNEVSGSTTIFEVTTPETFTLELFHTADQEGGIPALTDAPNFSAVLNALKAQDLGNDGKVDNTLVLSSGDAYIPGVFFNASEDAFGGAGRGDILIQNALGFDAIAFGNHEFDQGTALVQDLIGGAADDPATADVDESFAGTAFPYLSGNLDFSTDENLAGLVVSDAQAPQNNSITASTVIDVNGEKIGVVGATTPTVSNANVRISNPGDVTVLPNPFDGVPTAEQLDALAAEIQTDVDALLAANPDVNKVVLLAHMQQLAIEQALAQRLQNVDIIVAGGSNTPLTDEDDTLRAGDTSGGTYPIIETGADGNPVAVVNTDGNYKYVGRLVVDFDENGVIIPESYDPTVSGAYATDAAGVAALNAEELVDPEIQAIVDALETEIIAKESNVFGTSSVFLNGTRGSVRTEETNLGNLTADANLAAAKAADPSVVISIKNGGGIRDDIGRRAVPAGGTGEPELLPTEAIPSANKPEGGISENDIANTLRFNNGLTLLTATAEELLAIMEHAVAETSEGATPGRFPQIAGFKFSFDDDAAAGDRIQSLAIVDDNGDVVDVVVQNSELAGDPTREFRLVTLGFLAGGGDGFPFPDRDVVDLEQADDAPRTGAATFAVDGSEQDALAEYLVTNFSNSPFDIADVGPDMDLRVQNLDFREDSVIPVGMGAGNGGATSGGTGGGMGNERVVLVGTPGDDVLEGGGGNDTLYGNGGMDLLVGNGGDDEIVGGSGKDTLRGGDGDDLIYGNGGGGDLIVGGAGNDMLYGEDSQETILGGAGNDQIFGNGGGDFIDPGTGTDFVWLGFDGDATVVINEGEGFTEVVGFKPGVTRLELGAGLRLSELSFTRQGRDAYIRKGDELLAIVEWMSAETTREAFL